MLQDTFRLDVVQGDRFSLGRNPNFGAGASSLKAEGSIAFSDEALQPIGLNRK